MINARTCLRFAPPLLAITLIAAPAVGTGAEIYSWKDSSGGTHYSDVPPAGTDVKTIRNAPPPASITAPAPPAGSKSIAEQELDFRKRRAEQSEARQKAQEEADRSEAKSRYCEQLSLQIKAIESGQRLKRFNSEGGAEYLNDEQRQAELERNRVAYDKSCR